MANRKVYASAEQSQVQGKHTPRKNEAGWAAHSNGSKEGPAKPETWPSPLLEDFTAGSSDQIQIDVDDYQFCLDAQANLARYSSLPQIQEISSELQKRHNNFIAEKIFRTFNKSKILSTLKNHTNTNFNGLTEAEEQLYQRLLQMSKTQKAFRVNPEEKVQGSHAGLDYSDQIKHIITKQKQKAQKKSKFRLNQNLKIKVLANQSALSQ